MLLVFALEDLLYTIAALMLLFCFIIHVIAVLRRDGFLFSDCFESLLFTVREENAVKSNTWAQFKAYKQTQRKCHFICVLDLADGFLFRLHISPRLVALGFYIAINLLHLRVLSICRHTSRNTCPEIRSRPLKKLLSKELAR